MDHECDHCGKKDAEDYLQVYLKIEGLIPVSMGWEFCSWVCLGAFSIVKTAETSR